MDFLGKEDLTLNIWSELSRPLEQLGGWPISSMTAVRSIQARLLENVKRILANTYKLYLFFKALC